MLICLWGTTFWIIERLFYTSCIHCTFIMGQVNHLVLQFWNVLLCFYSHLQASCDGALHRPHHDRHPRGHGTHVRHHLRRSSPLQQVSTPSYVPSTFHYVLQYSSSTAVFYVFKFSIKYIHQKQKLSIPDHHNIHFNKRTRLWDLVVCNFDSKVESRGRRIHLIWSKLKNMKLDLWKQSTIFQHGYQLQNLLLKHH